MVNRRKIIISVLILGAGIIFSFYIILLAGNSKKSDIGVGDKKDFGNFSLVKNPIDWIEEKFSDEENKSLSLKSADGENNITKNFIDGIVGSIGSENFIDGDGFIDKNAADKKIFNNATGKYKIDLGLIDFNSIKDSDIKISEDNSKEAKNKYLESIKNIHINQFGDFNKSYLVIAHDAFNKKDFALAIRAVNIYKNLLTDYYKLEIPSNWKDIHKKLISYSKNSEIIYSSMIDYDKDPMRAYLAVEMIEKSIINDTEQLRKDMEEKYKEIN